MLLAGDIGGTNARLALFEYSELQEPTRLEVFPSGDFSSFEEIVERFLGSEKGDVEAASFGIAGPVRDGRSLPVNLAWAVDARSMAASLGLGTVGLVNDLEATALGLPALSPSDLVTLNPGSPEESGTVGVIAAGTGLGEAGLVRAGGTTATIATEGGNAGFAPATHDESRLLDFLRTDGEEHVSVESVCSGYGLVNVFRWCLHEAGRETPGWLAGEDAPAMVSDLAQAGSDEVAERALGVFLGIYGSEAGNLALRLLATGGVYVAGGIAGKLLEALSGGPFMEAFVNKGRFSDLLRSIPVHIVTNDLTALLGAARHAAERRPLAPGRSEDAA